MQRLETPKGTKELNIKAPGSCLPAETAGTIRKRSRGPFLPDKLPTEGKDPRSRAAGYAYGWNDCLEEIKKHLLK